MFLVDLVLVVLILDDVRGGKLRAAYPVALVLNTVAAVASNYAHGWGWWLAFEKLIAGS